MGGCVSVHLQEEFVSGLPASAATSHESVKGLHSSASTEGPHAAQGSKRAASSSWSNVSRALSTTARSSADSLARVFARGSWSSELPEAQVHAAALPANSLVNVVISCTNLPTTSRAPREKTLSRGGACVVTQLLERRAGHWKEVGRNVELLGGSGSGHGRRNITVQYHFPRLQLMKVRIFRIEDVDLLLLGGPDPESLLLHDSLAEVKFLLSDLLTSSPGVVVKKDLRLRRAGDSAHSAHSPDLFPASPAARAVCHLSATEVPPPECPPALGLCSQVAGHRYLGLQTGRRVDARAVLRISRQPPGSEKWTPVFSTEAKRNPSNPVQWEQFELCLSQLDHAAPDQRLRLDLLHERDRHKPPGLVGTGLACASALEKLARGAQGAGGGEGAALALQLPASAKDSGSGIPAELLIKSCELRPRPSLLDYIEGGCRLGMMLAVDFSGAGRGMWAPARVAASPAQRSGFEQAIYAVGRVLKEYSSQDGEVACWGVGGAVTESDAARRFFALNGDPEHPSVPTVVAACEAYRGVAAAVHSSERAVFAPVIAAAAAAVRRQQPQWPPRIYNVLLIVTEAIPADMAAMLHAVWDCSHLPMSVLMMGLGDADFTPFEALNDSIEAPRHHRRHKDSKDADLQSACNAAFVAAKITDSSAGLGGAAEKLLRGLPQHLLHYFASRSITPNDLLTVEDSVCWEEE